MDQDSAFMSLLMKYRCGKVDIKISIVAPFNYQSLQTDHSIKFLPTILTGHLTGLGEIWPF